MQNLLCPLTRELRVFSKPTCTAFGDKHKLSFRITRAFDYTTPFPFQVPQKVTQRHKTHKSKTSESQFIRHEGESNIISRNFKEHG